MNAFTHAKRHPERHLPRIGNLHERGQEELREPQASRCGLGPALQDGATPPPWFTRPHLTPPVISFDTLSVQTTKRYRTGGDIMQAEAMGGQRYRASYGRYLEDFTVGDIYAHRPGGTIK